MLAAFPDRAAVGHRQVQYGEPVQNLCSRQFEVKENRLDPQPRGDHPGKNRGKREKCGGGKP
jgi:hypothetical protein